MCIDLSLLCFNLAWFWLNPRYFPKFWRISHYFTLCAIIIEETNCFVSILSCFGRCKKILRVYSLDYNSLFMDCFIPGRCSYWDFLKVIGYWKFQKIIVIPFEHLQKLYWFWKFEGCSSKIRRATPIWILKWFWQEIHFFVHLEPSSSGFR